MGVLIPTSGNNGVLIKLQSPCFPVFFNGVHWIHCLPSQKIDSVAAFWCWWCSRELFMIGSCMLVVLVLPELLVVLELPSGARQNRKDSQAAATNTSPPPVHCNSLFCPFPSLALSKTWGFRKIFPFWKSNWKMGRLEPKGLFWNLLLNNLVFSSEYVVKPPFKDLGEMHLCFYVLAMNQPASNMRRPPNLGWKETFSFLSSLKSFLYSQHCDKSR